MNVIKNFALWFSKMSFNASVGTWIVFAALVTVFGTSGPIKNVLEEGRAYDDIVAFAVEQARVETGTSVIPLSDAEIKEVTSEIYSPEKLQGYTEEFLDGTYRWLEGTVEEPDFKIELGNSQELLAESVSEKLGARLASLPTCTSIPPQNVDLISLDCIPPGLDIKAEQNKLANSFAGEKSSLPSGTFTAADLADKESGEPFAEKYSEAPEAFQGMKGLPFVFAFLAVLFGAAVVLLASSRSSGFKYLGKSLIGNGGVVLFGAVLFGLILPASSQKYAYDTLNESAPAMSQFFTALINLIAMSLVKVSGLVIGLGALILINERNLFKKHDLGGNTADQASRL